MNMFYTNENNRFVLKQNKNFEITMLILLFSTFGYFMYSGEQFNSIPYWVFLIFPTLLFLYRVGRKVVFYTDKKIAQISIFGFLKQEHLLQNFERLLLINHKSYYFFNNGKEVKLLFRYNSEAVEISILRKNSFKDIDEFVKETDSVILKCLE